MSVKESIGCKFLINKAGALLLRRRSDGRYGFVKKIKHQ